MGLRRTRPRREIPNQISTYVTRGISRRDLVSISILRLESPGEFCPRFPSASVIPRWRRLFADSPKPRPFHAEYPPMSVTRSRPGDLEDTRPVGELRSHRGGSIRPSLIPRSVIAATRSAEGGRLKLNHPRVSRQPVTVVTAS